MLGVALLMECVTYNPRVMVSNPGFRILDQIPSTNFKPRIAGPIISILSISLYILSISLYILSISLYILSISLYILSILLYIKSISLYVLSISLYAFLKLDLVGCDGRVMLTTKKPGFTLQISPKQHLSYVIAFCD